MVTAPRQCSRIATSADAVAFLALGFRGMRRESLRIVHLDCDRRVIGVRLHYSSRSDAVDFPVRTIIGDALALGTHAIILAHNHPSGDPNPSRHDLIATRALVDLARPLGIRLYDHPIFAEQDWCSLSQMGLI